MNIVAFKRRTLEDRNELENLDYELLEAKEKVVGLGYYEAKRKDISLSWLEEESTEPEQNYIWHASMPLPLWQCKEIFRAAAKMPKDICRDLVFPDYSLGQAEEQLFEVVYAFGRAKGLDKVLSELYTGAANGDPRAVKMYLEVHKLLEESRKDTLDNLLRVELSL